MNIAQQFLLYANRIDSHKRAELTSVLAKAYSAQREPHPDQENVLLALMAMAADPAIEVRRALSEVVAGSNQFPRSLHVALTKDVALVAEPIFAKSKVLSDPELMAGLANNNQWVQCAIAARSGLSDDMVEALAKTASSVAVLSLLRNDDCTLTHNASEWIWQRFADPADPDHKHVMLCLTRRQDVSALVKLKVDFLGEIANEPPLPDMKILERRLDQILDHSVRAEQQELPFIAAFLRDRQWLNTVLIIRAALAGQIGFTAALLAEAANIKTAHALRLCRMGGFGLRALCRYAGLSKDSGQLLALVLHALKFDQEGQEMDAEGLTHVMTTMEAQGATEEDLLYCMITRLQARKHIDEAQKLRYDLSLKAISDPDFALPSTLQDQELERMPVQDVAVLETAQAEAKTGNEVQSTSKVLPAVFGATKSGNAKRFASLSYGNLAYQALATG